MHQFFSSKPNRLWLVLSGFFVTNALVAEFMGVKLFSLEKTFGLPEANLSLFGQSGLSFTLTAGVLLWPAVFLMTDIINEYFGRRGVRMLSYLTAGLIAYGFVMLWFAIQLDPAESWRTAHIHADWSPEKQAAARAAVGDYNSAYSVVFGQSQWIIVGSLLAFLLGQIVDVATFHKIKERTGEDKIWLRATGSTLVSQFIDSFVVVFIALYLGLRMPFLLVFAISVMSYIYKAVMAIVLTPVIYLVHRWIDNYLGEDLAREMKSAASR